MGFREVYEWLMSEFEGFTIIDAHEHLPPERERVSRRVDVFTLFTHYTSTDLITAGMSREDYEKIIDPEQPLEERWRLFKPYYKVARYTSYFRAARIALREFYGVEDLTDENYLEVSRRVREANKPGIYERVLRDKCRIKVVLTQIGRIPEEDRELLVPILPMWLLTDVSKPSDLEAKGLKPRIDVSNLGDYVAYMKEQVERWRREGVVGLKFLARRVEEVSQEKAEQLFDRLLEGELMQPKPLWDYLVDKAVDVASEVGWPISVHTGILAGNWGDFTATRPTLLIPLVKRHREAKFDVYHAGIPWVREAGILGKSFPNVWLNLCWCHIVSQEMTCSALTEWLDLVPVNKIIGFGGDYNVPVEKVYGHLVMAREDIARVLADRVSRGLMNREEALEIAHMWFYDNPKELYRLNV